MTQKSMIYDNAAYLARSTYAYGQNAAGANTNFGKFVAFTSLLLFAIEAAAIVASTSTQTAWNGTGTVVNINGDQFNLIHVINAPGAVTTATHGPFSLSTGTSTTTSSIGSTTRVQLSGTGTTGNVQGGASVDGGVVVNAGDTLHILRGTDATATTAYAIEFAVQPNALISN